MTLRRYAPMKQYPGTVWPPEVARAIHARDRGRCVGPLVGMAVECYGQVQKDHIRASGALGKKSESTLANGVLLCPIHHRIKTEGGRHWRPLLIAYVDGATAP